MRRGEFWEDTKWWQNLGKSLIDLAAYRHFLDQSKIKNRPQIEFSYLGEDDTVVEGESVIGFIDVVYQDVKFHLQFTDSSTVKNSQEPIFYSVLTSITSLDSSWAKINNYDAPGSFPHQPRAGGMIEGGTSQAKINEKEWHQIQHTRIKILSIVRNLKLQHGTNVKLIRPDQEQTRDREITHITLEVKLSTGELGMA